MPRLWITVSLVIALGAVGVHWLIARPAPARAFSGLEFSQTTDAAAARAPFLATRGALVVDVVPGSPAARAGIQKGAVVAAIDGVPVTSARQASGMVRAHGHGERVVFTLFDEARGKPKPKKVAVVFAPTPPENKKIFRVEPVRTLAKEKFHQPPMAANAAWSHRLAHGPSIRPRELLPLRAGVCGGLAPEQWRVRDYGKALVHLQSKDGRLHALYKIVSLSPAQQRDPKGAVLGLVHAVFRSPASATPTETNAFGVNSFNFGNRAGTAGLALWRSHGALASIWIAGVPASDIAWALPAAASCLFSLHCDSVLPPQPRDPSLAATAVSVDCLEGRCQDSDFAATILTRFRLGYVHGSDGQVYLVDPKRDFWLDGQGGPGFYRQVGGENEKLEPGRVN